MSMFILIIISVLLVAVWGYFVSSTCIFIRDNIKKELDIILFEPGWFSFGALFRLLPEVMISIFFVSMEALMAIGIFYLIRSFFTHSF